MARAPKATRPKASGIARPTARRYRSIQSKRARDDSRRPYREAEEAVQTGASPYPAPPMPRQHHRNPGQEARLDPAPM